MKRSKTSLKRSHFRFNTFMDKDTNQRAADRLALLILKSEVHTGLQLISEIASSCGISHVRGLPIVQFYEAARAERIEQGLASGSDHNPAQISAMKQLWERLKNRPTSEED